MLLLGVTFVMRPVKAALPPPNLTMAVCHIMISDIEDRNTKRKITGASREILLSFWKVHILHHASEGPVHGQWVLTELRRHGYEISPGTLYPLLHRMRRNGWLKGRKVPGAGPRARMDYRLAAEGQKVLALVREQLKELYGEVVK